MKAVILAGGRGTRISEESHLRPKPMIEIGPRPILWHIMKIYAQHGVTDFVICLGYRGYMIKEYFANFVLHSSDVTVDLATNTLEFHDSRSEPWRVTLVDTGEETMTGGRVRRIRSYVGDDDFCLTYGDGVADVDIAASIDFHRTHGRAVTMTVVRPPARYGDCTLDGDLVATFDEKPQVSGGGYINGGFFVVSPRAIDAIEGDDTPWEREPLRQLTAAGEVAAWRHEGFWQPMDTLREREQLEALWDSGRAPWKTW